MCISSVRVASNINNILEATESALQDGVIKKDELKEIKNEIKDSDLPQATKDKLTKVLDKASSDSRGFLGIFGRGISNNELSELKKMVSSLGNDSPLNSLYKTIEESVVDNRNVSVNDAKTLPASKHEANNFSFVDFFKPKSANPDKSSSSIDCVTPTSASIPNPCTFYVSQNGNGLSTGGRDCGPASASMVLKRFGVFNENMSSKDAILSVRQASGNKSTAFTESQFERSVETLSNGKVKMTEDKSGFGKDPKIFADYLKNEIDKGLLPVIEVGSPYHDNNANFQGRHFMVVSEVKDDGSVVVADPGGKQITTLSPERLEELLRKGMARGNHVLSFGAN